jgi:signal transduction histidine kinase
MGVELMRGNIDARRKAELEYDIAELDQLIEEMLLASRLDTLTALEADEDVDLLALAAEECARYEHCSLEGKAVAVRGDAKLLRRMIRNLLENAQRHGKPPIEVELRRVDAKAVIDVSDQGPGIAESERERLFSPFHRIAGTEGGSGLGLALVRQIARRHGGDVVYGSRGGCHSCFSVTLPASVVAPEPTRAAG